MRTLAKAIALLLVSLTCFVANAADMAQGLDALDRGDYQTALKELRPLAERGNARAQYRLGTMYALGHGLRRDYQQGVKWLSQAAGQGNAQAENDLGVLYELGRGVQADPKTAGGWFRKAAEKGVGAAQLSLAMLYQEGRGVPQDPVEAFAWANAATQYGEAHAQKLLDAIAKGLTPAQLHLAQKRAAKYERKYVAPFRTY